MNVPTLLALPLGGTPWRITIPIDKGRYCKVDSVGTLGTGAGAVSAPSARCAGPSSCAAPTCRRTDYD